MGTRHQPIFTTVLTGAICAATRACDARTFAADFRILAGVPAGAAVSAIVLQIGAGIAARGRRREVATAARKSSESQANLVGIAGDATSTAMRRVGEIGLAAHLREIPSAVSKPVFANPFDEDALPVRTIHGGVRFDLGELPTALASHGVNRPAAAACRCFPSSARFSRFSRPPAWLGCSGTPGRRRASVAGRARCLGATDDTPEPQQCSEAGRDFSHLTFTLEQGGPRSPGPLNFLGWPGFLGWSG
jgi:hypothetical protein